MLTDEHHGGNYTVTYECIISTCCTPSSYTMLHVTHLSFLKKKVKMPGTEWEVISSIHVTDRGPTSRIYKHSWKSTIKRLKNKSKACTSTSQRKAHQWLVSIYLFSIVTYQKMQIKITSEIRCTYTRRAWIKRAGRVECWPEYGGTRSQPPGSF